MYEIKKKQVMVNQRAFNVYERRVKGDCSSMVVTAGTTGFKGRERHKGGRAFVCIRDSHNSDLFIRPLKDKHGMNKGVEIAVSGDDGIMNLTSALLFASKTLCDGAAEVNE